MQAPIRIDFHGMQPSSFIERCIRDRAAKLLRLNDRIAGCRVMVEAPHHRRRHGNLYQVHIGLRVPGAALIVNRNPWQDRTHADLRVAVRDAFNAAERRLADSCWDHSGLRTIRERLWGGDGSGREQPLRDFEEEGGRRQRTVGGAGGAQ